MPKINPLVRLLCVLFFLLVIVVLMIAVLDTEGMRQHEFRMACLNNGLTYVDGDCIGGTN